VIFKKILHLAVIEPDGHALSLILRKNSPSSSMN